MGKYVLAIDQGTTGSRAVIYDKRGNRVAGSYREFAQIFPAPGWVEHDPAEIWGSVNSVIQEVLKEVPGRDIAAIGITNQRETTVLWDKETGKPVHNAIVWQCRRTAARCDRLKKDKKAVAEIHKKTGLPVDAYFSATKIEWIFKEFPGALKRARAGRIIFGTPDTWVLWNLTGGAAHLTDYSNASRTMLFDIDKLAWDKDLCRRFSVPMSVLPGVRSSSGEFAKTARIGSLPAGIPICAMAGDQQSALFGQTCFRPGQMKNTYGTGCFMLMNAGRKRPTSRHGLITTLACGHKGEAVYALEGAVFIGGAAIQWLRDGLKIIKSAPESEGMSTAIKDNEGVYFVPALVGLGAPYWDQDARGAFFGITRGTTPNHFVRAAVEAMCYQTKDVIVSMEKDSGLKVRDLRIDGGAVKNDFLCRFQADILGIDVLRPRTVEITSLGAAYLAGLSCGFWKSSGEIEKLWKTDRRFTPRMTRKNAGRYYDGWKDAVRRTLSEPSGGMSGAI